MTLPAWTVRRALPEDARAIAEAHVASWRDAYDGIVPRAVLDRLSVERRAAFWRETLGDAGGVDVQVADLAGAVAGFVSAGPARDEDLPPHTGEIHAIYLKREAWSQGIGRELLRAADADLHRRGFGAAVLWVLADNERGRRFYERQGWLPDGATRDLDFDGTHVEELRYRRPAVERPRALGG